MTDATTPTVNSKDESTASTTPASTNSKAQVVDSTTPATSKSQEKAHKSLQALGSLQAVKMQQRDRIQASERGNYKLIKSSEEVFEAFEALSTVKKQQRDRIEALEMENIKLKKGQAKDRRNYEHQLRIQQMEQAVQLRPLRWSRQYS